MAIDLSKLGIDVGALDEPEFSVEGVEQVVEEPVAGPDNDLPIFGPHGKLKREIDRFNTGYAMDNSVANLAHVLAEPFFPVEEGFDILDHPEKWQDIPEDRREDIQRSSSTFEADFMRDKVLKEIETEEEFMRGGVKSAMAYRLLGNIVDPLTLAGGAAEFKALHMLSKASRLTRMAASGGIAAATTAAQMAPMALNSSSVDLEDVFYNTAGALVLGGALGSLGGSADDITREAALHADSAGEILGRDIQKKMDEILVGVRKPDVPPVEVTTDILGPGVRSVGSEVEEGAEVALEGNTLLTAQSRALQEHAAAEVHRLGLKEAWDESKIAKVLEKYPLMSDFVFAFKMKGDMAKYWAHHVLESGSGIGAAEQSVSLMQRLNRTKLLTKVNNWRGSYADYAKAHGVSPRRISYWGATRRQYNRDLIEELVNRSQADKLGRLADYVSEAHPSIIKQADAWQDMASSSLSLLKSSGTRGAADIVETAGYFPLRWQGRTLNRVFFKDKEAYKAYEALLTTGYISEGIDAKAAERIAKAVFRRARTTDLGFDANPGALLAKDSRGLLEEILSDNGVSLEDIADVFRGIDRKVGDAGKASFARRRTVVDLSVTDQEGRSLIDLIDTDMPKMGQQYASEVAGRTALAKKGITSDADWMTLRNATIEDARAHNSPEDVARLVKVMDGVYNQLLGRPVGKGVAKPARRLMDWSMLTALGQNGFAQGAESTSVFAAHGLVNTLKKAPTMRRMIKGLRAGDAEIAGVLGELRVALGAIWDEHLLMAPNVHLDEFGDAGGFISSVDAFTAAAKDKLGYWSGMNQIKSMQQKFTVALQTDKVFKALRKGDMDKTILERFSELGWNKKTLSRLRKHIDNGDVTFQSNGAVQRLNMDNWNPQLVEDFSLGLHRHTHQVIQSQLVGESAYWQHETIGAMLTQFRSYPLAAMEKQLARHGMMGDAESFAMLSYGLALSSTVTLARASIYDITDSNDKAALAEALTPQGMVAGSLRYLSVMGILPEGVSAVGSIFGYDPINLSARKGSNSIINNLVPALSAPTRAIRATTGLAQALTGQAPLKDSTIKNTFGALPLGNTLPFQTFSHGLQYLNDEE